MGKAYLGKAAQMINKHGRTKYNRYKYIMYISLGINLLLGTYLYLTTVLHYNVLDLLHKL